jgi:hypothetical protein
MAFDDALARRIRDRMTAVAGVPEGLHSAVA